MFRDHYIEKDVNIVMMNAHGFGGRHTVLVIGKIYYKNENSAKWHQLKYFLIISFFSNLGLGLLVFIRRSHYYKKINIVFSLHLLCICFVDIVAL